MSNKQNKIPLHQFYVPERDTSIPFEISRIEDKPIIARSPEPNRHTFYELFYLTAGSGLHYIDFKGYPIQPYTFYAVTPGQIHYWDIDQPVTGYALIFLDEFLSLNQLNTEPLRDFDFYHRIDRVPIISLVPQQVPSFQAIIDLLLDEFQRQQSGRAEAIQAQLRYLLICLQRHYETAYETGSSSSEAIMVEQFQRLIDKNFVTLRTVQAYADLMGITSRYLTMVTTQVTGQPAGVLIRNRLAIEAKRLLAYTNLTVGEICRTLHFADQSYFGRFFKRETGQSPLTFRSSFRKNTKF